MFRCPECHVPLDEAGLGHNSLCSGCGLRIENVDGIPLLVRDRHLIERVIADAAQSGREAWFRAPQIGQWTGPYRHHVKKRKQWVEEILAEWTARHDGAPIVGLDLGCGDGANLDWLRSHVSRLYGSDYNLLRLLRAAKLGVDTRLFMADICNYPSADDSFDIIFFNHVLEHIPDDLGALQEVLRILKPGGMLILGVPNEGAAFWQFAYRMQPRIKATSDHRNFYTAQSLAARCEAAGLTVQKIRPIGWGVPLWTLDAVIRRFKWVDDVLELIGRRFLPSQATSLYAVLSK